MRSVKFMSRNWKKELKSIPNVLSIFRLLLIPVYTIIFLQAGEPWEYWLAGGILIVSTLTDLFDGKIARRYNMVTEVGKVLDPFADKMTQLTLIVCLALRRKQIWPVLGLFVVKECFMLVMGIVNLRKGKMLDGALMSGKICTTILFVCLILMVLLPNLSNEWIAVLVTACLVSMLVTFGDYIRAYFGKEKKVRDIPT